MSMRIKLIALFILLRYVAMGQVYNDAYKFIAKYDLPKSPNASSFERYISVPGNYQTGQVNPTIPLLSFTVDGITVPVNLNYSNTGLKIADVASWVGLGWNLNVGGTISRVVKGLPDDDQTGLLTPMYATYLDRLIHGQMTGLERAAYFKRITQHLVDTEHDLFQYQVLGIRGSFYINKDGQCIQIPRTNNKITFTKDSYNRLLTFTITDDKGTQYFFDVKEESKVLSIANAISGNTKDYFNSLKGTTWHLSKIVTRNEQIINFSYNHYQYTKTEKTESETINSISPGNNLRCITYQSGQTGFTKTYIKTTIDVYQLKQIFWKDGFLQFDAGDNRSDLKQIDVNAAVPCLAAVSLYWTPTPFSTFKGKLLRTVSFTYAQSPRLFLKAVDLGSLNKQQYTFSYKSELYPTWPSYNCDDRSYNAQDYWGYYNGQIYNYELIPYDAVSDYPQLDGNNQTSPLIGINRQSWIGRNNRVPDPAYASYGMLEIMTYPTGGRTAFTYEGNMVEKNKVQTNTSESLVLLNTLQQSQDAQNNVLVSLGGVRIKKVEFYTDASLPMPTTVTNMKYDQTNFNNGFLPYFVNHLLREKGTFPDGSNNSDNSNGITPSTCYICGNPYFFTLYSSSVVSNPGPVVEYGTVTEFTGTTNIAGQTVYNYNPSTLGQGYYFRHPYATPFYKSWQGGETVSANQLPDGSNVYKKSYLNGQNDPFTNLPTEERLNNFDYDFFVNVIQSDECDAGTTWSNKPDYTPASDSEADMITSKIYRWENVEISTENYVPKQTAEISYTANSQAVEKTVDYNYSLSQKNLLLPNSAVTTGSKGELTKTLITYPQDYFSGTPTFGTDPIANGLVNLIDKNLLSLPVEQISIISKSGVDYVTGASLTIFNADQPTISQVCRLSLTSPVLLSSYTKSSINTAGAFVYDNRYQLIRQFSLYNSAHQPIEFSELNGPKQAIIWDKTSLNVIAQVKNSLYKNVFYQGFEETDGNSDIDDAHTGHQSKTGGYTHNLTGLDNGDYEFTYWVKSNDSWLQQIIAVKVTNGTYSITVDGSSQIDDICFCPKGAQITTYTHDPLVGMTSSTDAKGQTTYYEYDDFQRLVTIRNQNRKVLKSFCYNYAGQVSNCSVGGTGGSTGGNTGGSTGGSTGGGSTGGSTPTTYSSAINSKSYAKNSCGAGYIGSDVVYTVAANAYTSTISQADADQKAANDQATNGQQYANDHGSCTQSATVTLTGTSSAAAYLYKVTFSGGPTILSFNMPSNGSSTITVPAGTYSVTVYPTSGNENVQYRITCGSQSITAPRTQFDNVVVSATGTLQVSIQ
jgi:YD repeat-containing protein